jgi:hypothetical protein
MPRRPIINKKKTQITATNFSDASGHGADEAKISMTGARGIGGPGGHSHERERSAGDLCG